MEAVTHNTAQILTIADNFLILENVVDGVNGNVTFGKKICGMGEGAGSEGRTLLCTRMHGISESGRRLEELPEAPAQQGSRLD